MTQLFDVALVAAAILGVTFTVARAIREWRRSDLADQAADDIERGEHLQDAPTEPKGPCGEVPGFACFCCEPKGHEGAHVCGCSTVPHAIGESDE